MQSWQMGSRQGPLSSLLIRVRREALPVLCMLPPLASELSCLRREGAQQHQLSLGIPLKHKAGLTRSPPHGMRLAALRPAILTSCQKRLPASQSAPGCDTAAAHSHACFVHPRLSLRPAPPPGPPSILYHTCTNDLSASPNAHQQLLYWELYNQEPNMHRQLSRC